jgi:hypothetical protein
MRIGLRAVLPSVILALIGCAPHGEAAPAESESSEVINVDWQLVDGCLVPPVHSGPLPAPVAGFSDDRAIGLPWMGNRDFLAILFYAKDSNDIVMSAGGKMAEGQNTKILPPRDAGASMQPLPGGVWERS